jgi:hypothetical protein
MDKKKKIPGKIRREIRQRAKVESGMKGAEATKPTAAGRVLRKTFTKSKTGVKLVGQGTKRGSEERPKPVKPKYKKVDVQARKFGSEGEVESSKTRSGESKEELKSSSTESKKEVGSSGVKSKSDVGKKEFKENLEKKNKYKKDLKKAAYKKGERTELQKKKSTSLRNARTASIKAAGGNVRKGERRLKGVLKKRMKKDYRENNYNKY